MAPVVYVSVGAAAVRVALVAVAVGAGRTAGPDGEVITIAKVWPPGWGGLLVPNGTHNRHWGFALARRALANQNARSRQQSEGAGGCVAVMSFAVGRHNNNGFIYKPTYKPS